MRKDLIAQAYGYFSSEEPLPVDFEMELMIHDIHPEYIEILYVLGLTQQQAFEKLRRI